MTLGAVFVASCSTSPSGPADVGGGSSATQAPTAAPEAATDVQSRSDLLNEADLEWTRWEILDGTHVRVFFVGDNPKCHGIHTTVEETSTTVTIALRQGTVPDAPEACAAVAYQGSALVSLASPVAARSIAQSR
jgi:hypothetical protein